MTTAPSTNPSKTIATALQMLIDGGSNYLVVSSGHAYLQFMRNCCDDSMLTEAPSNTYLAPEWLLDEAAIATLHDLGFEDPADSNHREVLKALTGRS